MSAEKCGTFLKRLPGFGDQMRDELPGVRNDGPNLQVYTNTGRPGAFGEPSGIIEQNFISAYVNEKRGQTGEIGVEGRGERIARVGVAEIVASREGNAGALEHGAAVIIGSNGVAGGGEVGPGRKERRGRRERNARGSKREHEGKRETAASGLSRDDDVLWRVSRAQQGTVKGDSILDGGGETTFRRKAIVRSKDVEALKCVEHRDGAMSLRRAGEVSAAVKIQEDVFARRWTLNAFAGDSTEMRGRNLDGGWNFVGIGAEDFAGDAIVPNTFQTALDAPFNDPHRKPRLKAD